MRRSILALAVASAFVLASAPVWAQRGQGGPKTPKVKVAQPLHASPSQGPKVKSSPTTTKVHGPKTTTTKTGGPKTTTTKSHGKPTTTTTTASSTRTKGPDRGRPTTTSSTTSDGSTMTGSGAAGSTADGTVVSLSPVQQKLQKNTNLASKLEGRLPQGTNLMDAAEGFRNLGQFVAAVNVSDNLGISFTELKARMVDDGMSLGQAIKAERNDVDDVTLVVRQAERDAQTIISQAEEDAAAAKQGTTSTKTSKTGKRGGGR